MLNSVFFQAYDWVSTHFIFLLLFSEFILVILFFSWTNWRQILVCFPLPNAKTFKLKNLTFNYRVEFCIQRLKLAHGFRIFHNCSWFQRKFLSWITSLFLFSASDQFDIKHFTKPLYPFNGFPLFFYIYLFLLKQCQVFLGENKILSDFQVFSHF